MPFITRVITGSMVAMARLTNRVLPVRSLLAESNRFCIKSWLAKARTTIRPGQLLPLTRLSRSTRLCIFLNRGSATLNSTRINVSIRASASASTQAS